jgi:hypothetical protein
MSGSILINPNYGKEFQLFSFTFDFTMVVVLLQKNQQGSEQPIAFMKRHFRGQKLAYASMEKGVYALVKS